MKRRLPSANDKKSYRLIESYTERGRGGGRERVTERVRERVREREKVTEREGERE